MEIPTSEVGEFCIRDVMHPSGHMQLQHPWRIFIHSLAKKLGYEWRIVRYQNIIGPEMGFGHAIPHIVERIVNWRIQLKFMVMIKQEPFVTSMMLLVAL